MNELPKAYPGESDELMLGKWLGRRQAYSLVAGTCSAADAKCLHEIRETKAYRKVRLTWEEFCRQHIGMHRTNVEQIIRNYKEFGPTYFTLHQLTGITADDYRAIRGAIEDGSLRYGGGAIPIEAEHAPRLLEAVRELAPPPARAAKPAAGPDEDAPYRAAEEALVGANTAIKRLREYRLAPADRQRLHGLVSTLTLEMRLIAALP